MTKINYYLTADTHGDIDIDKIKNWSPDTKNNVLIVLGDWGAIWFNKMKKNWKFLKFWNKQMKEKNFQLYVILGNHENYGIINQYKSKEIEKDNMKFIGKEIPIINPYTKEKLNSVYIIDSGLLKIKNKNILVIRGANSIDKEIRQIGISWWKEELLSYKEESIIFNFARNNKIDYIFSHTIPTQLKNIIFKNLYIDNDSVSNFMNNIYDEINYKKWYFGHFHIDLKFKDEKQRDYICLFDKIIKFE